MDSALALINDFGPVDVRKLDVDEAQQGLLIGRKGATISQLQESTGCALELRNTQLVIAGAAGAAETAEQRILEMLESQKRVEVIVKFDPEQKGTLLGKGGATIKRIQQVSVRRYILGHRIHSSTRIQDVGTLCVWTWRVAD